jgi:hypothetical protein
MPKIIISIVVLLFVSSNSMAGSRCHIDTDGHVTCERKPDMKPPPPMPTHQLIRSLPASTSLPTNDATYRFSNGENARVETDAYGQTTYRYGSGNVVRATPDAYGTTTYMDITGRTLRGSTDGTGATTFRDNFGNVRRVSTDASGTTTYTDIGGHTHRCVMLGSDYINCQ